MEYMTKTTPDTDAPGGDRRFAKCNGCRDNCYWCSTQRKANEKLAEYKDLEEKGRLLIIDDKTALALCAGGRAIFNNERLQGTTYAYDIFGERKTLSYYEAAHTLYSLGLTAMEQRQLEVSEPYKD